MKAGERRQGARLPLFKLPYLVDGHEIENYVGDVSDPALLRLREIIYERFRFDPTTDTVHAAVRTLANHRRFHPVRDYLDSLKWDGLCDRRRLFPQRACRARERCTERHSPRLGLRLPVLDRLDSLKQWPSQDGHYPLLAYPQRGPADCRIRLGRAAPAPCSQSSIRIRTWSFVLRPQDGT